MERLKVLLVDDEVEFISKIAERLSFREIDASTASSGEEALFLIESDLPDVMVLDVMMPGTRGIELLKLIRQEYPMIQVILLGGGDISAHERMEGMRLGAFDFLLKPLSIEELVEKVRKAVSRKGPAFVQ